MCDRSSVNRSLRSSLMSLADNDRIFAIDFSDRSTGPGGSCTFKAAIFPLADDPNMITRMRFRLYVAQHKFMGDPYGSR
jgi:hypothetical protein